MAIKVESNGTYDQERLLEAQATMLLYQATQQQHQPDTATSSPAASTPAPACTCACLRHPC
eukprot:scaffold167657_cov48-Prasinocladus_malaysianus.AAC.1